ncbi:MAG: hypothetical protein ACP5RK_00475, partial [Candidatus Micrarchaeia archaeon]
MDIDMDRFTPSVALLISLALSSILILMLDSTIINATSGKIYFANSAPQANTIAGNARVLNTM